MIMHGYRQLSENGLVYATFQPQICLPMHYFDF